jgi:hypothetical protein
MANHTIGVISTPKAGGTDPLIILNNGSVGHTTILYGASFKFAFGYHEMTTRQSYMYINRWTCLKNVYKHIIVIITLQ